MTFREKIAMMKRIHFLIKMKSTGNAKTLSNTLEISERCLYDLLHLMKDLGAPIAFSHFRQTYYYEYDADLHLGYFDTTSNNKVNKS